jgi:hypothetical protein
VISDPVFEDNVHLEHGRVEEGWLEGLDAVVGGCSDVDDMVDECELEEGVDCAAPVEQVAPVQVGGDEDGLLEGREDEGG